MSKDAFWALIQEAKTACGQDLNAMEYYLQEQHVSMGPAAAKNFHDILQTYEELADLYGLWDAVSVIKEYGCSDDGFIDFRAWLIAQGKEVYMNALRDPDTLADIEPYGDCCFECLSYVGDYAYEQLTGRSAYDEMEPDRIEKMRDEYDGRRRYLVEGLRRIGLPCFEPNGAFYVFPDIRGTGLTSDEFCERFLREEKVAVISGAAFGPGGEGVIRCCYATSMKDIAEALTRMDNFLTNLRKKQAREG